MPTVTTKLRVLLIPVEGPSRAVEIDDAHTALQQLVGGFFEQFLTFKMSEERALLFWCDEGGLLKKLPVNGSPILARLYAGDLRGPVVVTAGDLTDGESYSLTSAELELLTKNEAR
jgi:hypothetical protein